MSLQNEQSWVRNSEDGFYYNKSNMWAEVQCTGSGSVLEISGAIWNTFKDLNEDYILHFSVSMCLTFSCLRAPRCHLLIQKHDQLLFVLSSHFTSKCFIHLFCINHQNKMEDWHDLHKIFAFNMRRNAFILAARDLFNPAITCNRHLSWWAFEQMVAYSHNLHVTGISSDTFTADILQQLPPLLLLIWCYYCCHS